MIKVAIVDDHAVVRMGVKYTLELEADMSFAGECSNGADAAAFVQKARPDVTLLDVRMPGTYGIAALRQILAAVPNAKIMMLSTSDGDDEIYRSMKLGAKGYILKDKGWDEIAKGIRIVAAGGTFLPDDVRELYAMRATTPDPSPRELEVMQHLVDGCTNDEIAQKMGISRDGVKMHIKHILEKLDARDRTEVVAQVLLRGFVRRN